MDALLSLLGIAGLWILWELVGSIVGELLFQPVFDRLGRVFGPMLNRWSLALLWGLAAVSLGVWPTALRSESTTIRVIALLAFVSALPLALLATYSLRARLQPSVQAAKFPLTRVLAGAISFTSASATVLLLLEAPLEVRHWATIAGLSCWIFGSIALLGRIPLAGHLTSDFTGRSDRRQREL